MIERASGTGSGRSNTEFTTAKVAVFAAIQTAMVRTTVTVNPLSPISERTACRRLRKTDSIVTNTPSAHAGVAGTLTDFVAEPGRWTAGHSKPNHRCHRIRAASRGTDTPG